MTNATDAADIVVDLDETDQSAAPALPAVDADLDDDKILPKGCERLADGSVIVPLLYPRTVTARSGGVERVETYDKLTFRRLTGADLAAMRATAPKFQSLVIMSRSARVPQRIMTVLYDKMDGEDVSRCDSVLASFLG